MQDSQKLDPVSSTTFDLEVKAQHQCGLNAIQCSFRSMLQIQLCSQNFQISQYKTI